MLGGNSGNPLLPVFVDENRMPYQSNASNPLQLFSNCKFSTKNIFCLFLLRESSVNLVYKCLCCLLNSSSLFDGFVSWLSSGKLVVDCLLSASQEQFFLSCHALQDKTSCKWIKHLL